MMNVKCLAHNRCSVYQPLSSKISPKQLLTGHHREPVEIQPITLPLLPPPLPTKLLTQACLSFVTQPGNTSCLCSYVCSSSRTFLASSQISSYTSLYSVNDNGIDILLFPRSIFICILLKLETNHLIPETPSILPAQDHEFIEQNNQDKLNGGKKGYKKKTIEID